MYWQQNAFQKQSINTNRFTPFSIVSRTNVDASCTYVLVLTLLKPEMADDSESEERLDWSKVRTTSLGPVWLRWFLVGGVLWLQKNVCAWECFGCCWCCRTHGVSDTEGVVGRFAVYRLERGKESPHIQIGVEDRRTQKPVGGGGLGGLEFKEKRNNK